MACKNPINMAIEKTKGEDVKLYICYATYNPKLNTWITKLFIDPCLNKIGIALNLHKSTRALSCVHFCNAHFG